MLEVLVPSKVRRTLFEHLLAHPHQRFYLRGLAKEIGLSISPLRRELKRLEASGMLRASAEGNMLFYTINAASPIFHQLTSSQPSVVQEPTPAPPRPASVPVHIGTIRAPARSFWSHPLPVPLLLGTMLAGLVVVGLAVGLFYATSTNQQLASMARRALTVQKPQVTVIPPIGGVTPAANTPPSTSSLMRGSRWQIVPGGVGGFSSGTNGESY